MKRISLIVAALALGLTGCAGGGRGREPEGTVLAQVLGVDRMGEVWLLTAAGPNGKGETVLQSVEGESLEETFLAVSGSGREWVSLKSVGHILLGDGVNPEEVLSFVIEDSGMSWRACVWYAPIAAAVIGEEEDGGSGRLTVLEETGGETVTVLEVLVGLKEKGKGVVPALVREDGHLVPSGFLECEVRRVE